MTYIDECTCIINNNFPQSVAEAEAAQGWEYAPLFNMKFHHKERRMDLVRRRRWHRKMVAEDPRAPCFFQIEDSDSVSIY